MNVWATDQVDNKDPDYVYEFPYEGDGKSRKNEVLERLKPRRLVLRDFETGNDGIYNVPGWEIVHSENSHAELAGYRPDEGKPIDTTLRHGPHVCMRIRKEHWEVLQRAQEQRADAYEERLQGGRTEEYNLDGQQVRMGRGQKPAIKITEQPLQRI